MNVNVLIDSIVRQTTVLIAQLATNAGVRAPLAHTANQVFLDLSRELKEQGLGNKVIADMFGIALRTYHSKVRRLSESRTDSGKSLWESVLTYVQQEQTTLRARVLNRFSNDDRATVCSVLKDLVDSGMVFQSGRGDRTTYRAASAEEYNLADSGAPGGGAVHLVWVAINRSMPVSLDELEQAVPIGKEQLNTCIQELLMDARIRQQPDDDGSVRYLCDDCVIPVGAAEGWEAAVFDHYQAMVTALCTKLSQGDLKSSAEDAVGGSTYSFDVWPGHPHYDEVMAMLRETRQRAVRVRSSVESYNRRSKEQSSSRLGAKRVLYYAGQTLLDPEETENREEL